MCRSTRSASRRFSSFRTGSIELANPPLQYGQLDRVQRDDLVQASIVLANFAYNTAMRSSVLPRKAMTPASTRPTQD